MGDLDLEWYTENGVRKSRPRGTGSSGGYSGAQSKISTADLAAAAGEKSEKPDPDFPQATDPEYAGLNDLARAARLNLDRKRYCAEEPFRREVQERKRKRRETEKALREKVGK